MVDDQVPSTSVLVDVVYVLGGDVVCTNAALAPEVAERLTAAAALLGVAQQIMHEIVESAIELGAPPEQVLRLVTDVRDAAGLISGDGDGTEWLRAG
ncbi:hypothetical protein GCM10010174_01720 [Kutzneria viridogrisea]|uniref:Uncharacterized protein n=2 Tax=Kutzneria TaxID=43356 RepID=W5W9D3_9PSEU|nr:hypothetical protein [Kutzneria albida]AHH97723.1 hypothetical protein KALB_4361 [Kutzneria albida DSM 43870]MBA8924691.1 hypothetical protein [Kutzneria viridogrisea]